MKPLLAVSLLLATSVAYATELIEIATDDAN